MMFGRPWLGLAAFALVGWTASGAGAIDIVAIEEHWELKIGQPDPASSSPQVTMVMSPTGDLDHEYFVFTLNHHSDPEWIPGGVQVQLWRGEEVVESEVGPAEGTLHHEDETITWVQRTSVEDGQLVFEVQNGQSESWESFGGQGHLRLSLASPWPVLNAYRPAVSIEESGVGFAGNRVRSLTLQKLRWIDSEGHVYELNAPIDVDADLDP